MKTSHTLREWEYLNLVPEGDSTGLSRAQADRLLSVARGAQQYLRLGGEDAENILVNGVDRLRAQQVVGVIVAPGASLEILPKIDGLESDAGATRANLVRMVARTLDLRISDGALTELGTQEDDLLEILIRLFTGKLFAAVHQGLPRRYIQCEDDLAALRGRLVVERQFTILAASPQKLASRFEELSSDIPLNQLMKFAVLRLRSITRSLENQRRLAELALAFADVTTPEPGDPRLQNVVLDRTNTAWHELVRLARLLIGQRYQTTSSGRVEGFSLLFEMNTLFEEYIGRTLSHHLRQPFVEVSLQGPRRHVLAEKNTAKERFRTIPDIVIHQHGKPVMVIDTKWKRLKGEIEDQKRGVGQADVYQMLAYGEVYDVRHLMLLYPHHEGLTAAEGRLGEYLAVGKNDRELSIASISLADLHSVATRLAKLVEEALEKQSLLAA